MIIKMYAYGRATGEYDDITGIYNSYTKYSEYVVIKFGGGGAFAISKVVVDDLVRLGCHTVMMPYHGVRGNKLFKTTLDQWIKSTKTITDKNNDADIQKCVCINDMEDLLVKKEVPQLPQLPPSLPPSAVPTKQTELKW